MTSNNTGLFKERSRATRRKIHPFGGSSGYNQRYWITVDPTLIKNLYYEGDPDKNLWVLVEPTPDGEGILIRSTKPKDKPQ